VFPTATGQPGRHLPLDGTFNIRDLGGYLTAHGHQTRWRTLLRADSLHRLTPAALEVLVGYGVRTVIDLRWTHETLLAPNPLVASLTVRYHHLSMFGDEWPPERLPATYADVYRLMLDERQAQIGRILATLAGPGALPALFHCAAGKDRTGVIAALALALVGVPAATIAEDYALSAHYLANAYPGQPPVECPPAAMLATLDHLETRHGGAERDLLAAGLTPADLTALRQALTMALEAAP
jgi:protein-tyrosine phosphatase